MTDEETLQERVATLEATVTELSERLDRATDHDIPLLKGTVRAILDADIDEIAELPDAGRGFNQRVGSHEDRLDTLERQLAALGDISSTKTTKEQKLAAVLHFATNKRETQSGSVTVTADEIQGCVGISRRYAYDLIEDAAELCSGVRVREARDVQTSTGVKHKKKALLVDCEAVRMDSDSVNQFTTKEAVPQRTGETEPSQRGDH